MRKAGAWFPWQIHGIRGSWAERRMEMRERRRKKGGAVRCPRQELAGAERQRTCAADGGIQSRPVGRKYTNQARGGVRMRTSSPSGRESAKHSTQFPAFQEAITFMIFSIEEGRICQIICMSFAWTRVMQTVI
ncbi:hypothetical protein VPH35_110544 [Triticum aestivum]